MAPRTARPDTVHPAGDPWLKVQSTGLIAPDAVGSVPPASEGNLASQHRCQRGPSPEQASVPEPPGQRRNEAVGVTLVVEDMGRDAHAIETRRDIDAFARKSLNQP
jgi:hypothetical protein